MYTVDDLMQDLMIIEEFKEAGKLSPGEADELAMVLIETLPDGGLL